MDIFRVGLSEYRLILYDFQRVATSTASAYYKKVDKKHGNFLSVKVYLGEYIF